MNTQWRYDMYKNQFSVYKKNKKKVNKFFISYTIAFARIGKQTSKRNTLWQVITSHEYQKDFWRVFYFLRLKE